MKLLALPAFSDNYLWLWHNDQEAVVVDPGEASPVLEALARLGLSLEHIVVTHHHKDHVGGIKELVEKTGAIVHGPKHDSIPTPHQVLQGGESIELLSQTLQVLAVPGHTATHLAYFVPSSHEQDLPILFCGDTLFSAGCGRLFEGSPQEMLNSLKALAQLPHNTQVCCAHEYTLSNLKFATHVDPHNEDMRSYLVQCEAKRQRGEPTLPSQLGLELQINPFLRAHTPSIIESVMAHQPGLDPHNEVAVFAALREWKNTF